MKVSPGQEFLFLFEDLVLSMTLGRMLTLSFQLDDVGSRSDTKFDIATASLLEWTNKSIARRPRGFLARHIILHCEKNCD